MNESLLKSIVAEEAVTMAKREVRKHLRLLRPKIIEMLKQQLKTKKVEKILARVVANDIKETLKDAYVFELVGSKKYYKLFERVTKQFLRLYLGEKK
jgi:hypothetical protein